MRLTIILVFIGGCLVAGCASPEKKIIALGNEIKVASYKRPRDFSPYAPGKTHVNANVISARKLRDADDENLQKLFNAASLMTFYFTDSLEYYGLQEKIFAELLSRKIVPDSILTREYKTRITARDFAAAAVLVQSFPGKALTVLPEIDEHEAVPVSSIWRGYGISNAGHKLTATVVPLSKGKIIMMVMSPGCGFVDAAMADLLADPSLAVLLRKYGIFVSSDFYPEDMASWGEKYKVNIEKIYISHKASNFPGVELGKGTPYFYFMLDGKIMAGFNGWCVHGRNEVCMAKFRRGLAAISLSPEHDSIDR